MPDTGRSYPTFPRRPAKPNAAETRKVFVGFKNPACPIFS